MLGHLPPPGRDDSSNGTPPTRWSCSIASKRDADSQLPPVPGNEVRPRWCWRNTDFVTKTIEVVRGRIFLGNALTGELKNLMWVEQKGDDFYWGSPYPAPDVASAAFGPGEDITIEIPEDLDQLPLANMKTSFHRSGHMHVTTNGSGAQEVRNTYVGKVTEFRKPTMFAAILTVPASGAPYAANPRKGRKAARTLLIPDELWHDRLYFDFSFAPEGCLAEPWEGIGFEESTFPEIQESVFLSRDLGLLMVVRAAAMSEELSAWRPEQTVIIRVTPEAPSVQGGLRGSAS